MNIPGWKAEVKFDQSSDGILVRLALIRDIGTPLTEFDKLVLQHGKDYLDKELRKLVQGLMSISPPGMGMENLPDPDFLCQLQDLYFTGQISLVEAWKMEQHRLNKTEPFYGPTSTMLGEFWHRILEPGRGRFPAHNSRNL